MFSLRTRDTTCETHPAAIYAKRASVSRGENWSEKTVREIAAETGFSEHHTWKQLRQLHERGKIERRRFKICTGTTVRPVPHYLHH
jgi:hypothetical protein